MTQDHRQAADQALVMDAPRIIRKDMTLLTEMMAKYQGLEGAFNGIGMEAAAEETSDLVVPLMNARNALEHVAEAINNASAPALPGISADDTQAATQAAFDLEDALMAFIEEHNQLPIAVHIRPDIWGLIQAAWPGRDSLQLAKGKVGLKLADDADMSGPFGFEVAQ